MRDNKTTRIGVLAAGMMISSLMLPPNMEAGMGKLWPFASKKHIKQQVDPVSGRVSELEEISRKHGAQIKEIDERTQSALKTTMSQVEEADVKAIAAGRRQAHRDCELHRSGSHDRADCKARSRFRVRGRWRAPLLPDRASTMSIRSAPRQSDELDVPGGLLPHWPRKGRAPSPFRLGPAQPWRQPCPRSLHWDRHDAGNRDRCCRYRGA